MIKKFKRTQDKMCPYVLHTHTSTVRKYMQISFICFLVFFPWPREFGSDIPFKWKKEVSNTTHGVCLKKSLETVHLGILQNQHVGICSFPLESELFRGQNQAGLRTEPNMR